MAQVSSVLLSVKAGDKIEKGDEISYFQFGGSDCVMVFEKRVHFKYSHKKKVIVRKQIATSLSDLLIRALKKVVRDLSLVRTVLKLIVVRC